MLRISKRKSVDSNPIAYTGYSKSYGKKICLIQQASASYRQVKIPWFTRDFLFDSCLIYKILQVKVKAL